jgi:hypothetical protein
MKIIQVIISVQNYCTKSSTCMLVVFICTWTINLLLKLYLDVIQRFIQTISSALQAKTSFVN